MPEEADELETKMRINSIQFNNDKVHSYLIHHSLFFVYQPTSDSVYTKQKHISKSLQSMILINMV